MYNLGKEVNKFFPNRFRRLFSIYNKQYHFYESRYILRIENTMQKRINSLEFTISITLPPNKKLFFASNDLNLKGKKSTKKEILD